MWTNDELPAGRKHCAPLVVCFDTLDNGWLTLLSESRRRNTYSSHSTVNSPALIKYLKIKSMQVSVYSATRTIFYSL